MAGKAYTGSSGQDTVLWYSQLLGKVIIAIIFCHSQTY